jgi:glycerate 2-kinase
MIQHPQAAILSRLIQAALQAVDPEQAVLRYMQRNGSVLQISETGYQLESFRRIWLFSLGKAGIPMARAAVSAIGDRLHAGLVITKEGHSIAGSTAGSLPLHPRVQVLETGHPVPDQRGVLAAQNLIAMLSEISADDLLVCLISGGGSALLPALAPGISLVDMQNLTEALLACGAVVNEINTLRKHLDLVKGGHLARLVHPAHMAVLILSDVIGNPLDVIASGPTVPDPSTYQDCLESFERYRLRAQVPAAVLDRLERGRRGEIEETPKPGDSVFAGVQNTIIGSNARAAAAALQQARAAGFNTLLLTTYLEGEARQAGRFLAGIARQVHEDNRPVARPACIIAGGETTVTLLGNGKGGRNQELALGAAQGMAGIPNAALLTLATDGGDGPTDAAGAVVSGETMERARRAGLSPDRYLANNDTYTFFQALGDLLITGPTQTNVNDLAFLLLF